MGYLKLRPPVRWKPFEFAYILFLGYLILSSFKSDPSEGDRARQNLLCLQVSPALCTSPVTEHIPRFQYTYLPLIEIQFEATFFGCHISFKSHDNSIRYLYSHFERSQRL